MQLHLASVCNCYIYLYSKLQVYVITAFGKTQLSGALLPPPPPPPRFNKRNWDDPFVWSTSNSSEKHCQTEI